jgi:hypothetical protein
VQDEDGAAVLARLQGLRARAERREERRREGLGPLALEAAAEGQRAEGACLEVALVLGADPVAPELGRDEGRVLRQDVEAVGGFPEFAVRLVQIDLEAVRERSLLRRSAREKLREVPYGVGRRVGKGPSRTIRRDVARQNGRGRVELGPSAEGQGPDFERHTVPGIVSEPAVAAVAGEPVGLKPSELPFELADAVAEAREAGARLPACRRGIGPGSDGAGGGQARVHRPVAARFLPRLEAGRPAPLPGDDVDDAADRVRPVERALRSAQHLDPLDRGRQEVGEVEVAGSGRRVVHPDPVDEDERLTRAGPAQAHARRRAGPARLRDVEARYAPQRIDERGRAEGLDLLPRHDRDGRCRPLPRLGPAVGRHHDVGQLHWLGRRLAGRGRAPRQETEKGERRGRAAA